MSINSIYSEDSADDALNVQLYQKVLANTLNVYEIFAHLA